MKLESTVIIETINELIKLRGISVSNLSKRIGMSTQNLCRLLNARDIKVSFVILISKELTNDPWFIFYSVSKNPRIEFLEETVKIANNELKRLKDTQFLG